MSKTLNIIAIFFMVSFCIGQTSKKELDSLFTHQVKSLFAKGEYQKSLALCQEVISGYKNINEKEGALEAYIYAANIYSNLYQIKESLHCLDRASEYIKEVNNPRLLSRLYAGYGRNFDNLGFQKNALEYFDKAIDIVKVDQQKYKKDLQYYYEYKALIYEGQDKIKEFYSQLKLSHKINPTVYTSARLAKYFISLSKNLDSAKYYLNLGDQLYTTGDFPIYQKAILKRNWGRYYLEKEQYQDAIVSLEESLMILKKLNKNQEAKENHKLLYEVYKKQKKADQSVHHLEKYTFISDSIESANKKLQEIPLNKILKEKEVHLEKKTHTKMYLGIFIFALLAIFAGLLYQRKIHQFKSEKEQNRIENDALKIKINDSFEELLKLAKENAPEFYAKFKETYPEVILKILEISPNLRVSELTLCAYIFLGFNAKDIARYTHKSINTIRNRKYNLRKKMNISEDVNLSLWFRRFDDEKKNE